MHSQIVSRKHMAGSETQMRMLMLWCLALRRDSVSEISRALKFGLLVRLGSDMRSQIANRKHMAG